MSYLKKVSEINVQARDELIVRLSNVQDQEVKLFDLENKDIFDDDSFYELPAQFNYSKYNYAILYYLHRVYLEDGKLYAEGYDPEEGEPYHFTPDDIATDNFCFLVDSVIETLD